MKYTTRILATAALLALMAAPAHAQNSTEPGMMDHVKIGFSQAIKDIQTWFGSDTPDTVEPAAGETGFDVTNDDAMQVPPPVDPSIIEPAAGGMDDDALQVPPPYVGPDNSDVTPRASAFDNNASNVAFGDVSDQLPVIEDYNAVAPAAGENDAAQPALDCGAITGASARGEEVDAALLEQCKNPAPVAPVASDAATVTSTPMEAQKLPAQPAFEVEEMPAETTAPVAPAQTPSAPVQPEALPETQPATGE